MTTNTFLSERNLRKLKTFCRKYKLYLEKKNEEDKRRRVRTSLPKRQIGGKVGAILLPKFLREPYTQRVAWGKEGAG